MDEFHGLSIDLRILFRELCDLLAGSLEISVPDQRIAIEKNRHLVVGRAHKPQIELGKETEFIMGQHGTGLQQHGCGGMGVVQKTWQSQTSGDRASARIRMLFQDEYA